MVSRCNTSTRTLGEIETEGQGPLTLTEGNIIANKYAIRVVYTVFKDFTSGCFFCVFCDVNTKEAIANAAF